jgi:hypothetical protein
MSALTLMIIRHAEKPDRAWPGQGLTNKGKEDDKSLVIRGWQRAGAWCALFGTSFGEKDFPRPDVIYAANADSDVPPPAGIEMSQRPFETVRPLSQRLGLKPIITWSVGQEEKLVDEITKLSGVVLVCWEHKRVVSTMLPAIEAGRRIAGLPSEWKGDRFDVVLRFDRSGPDGAWSFRQLFPQLLWGDSDTPVEKKQQQAVP